MKYKVLFMLGMVRNVWILLRSGALGMSIAPTIVFVGGIIGSSLAPSPSFALCPLRALLSEGVVVGRGQCVVGRGQCKNL